MPSAENYLAYTREATAELISGETLTFSFAPARFSGAFAKRDRDYITALRLALDLSRVKESGTDPNVAAATAFAKVAEIEITPAEYIEQLVVSWDYTLKGKPLPITRDDRENIVAAIRNGLAPNAGTGASATP
jgi:hypothetical protein